MEVRYTPQTKKEHRTWMEGWLDKACWLEDMAIKANNNTEYVEYMKAAWSALDKAHEHEEALKEM